MDGRGNSQVGYFTLSLSDGCRDYEIIMVADTTQATIYGYFELDVIRSHGHTRYLGKFLTGPEK